MLQLDMFKTKARTLVNVKIEPTVASEGRLHAIAFAFLTQSDMIDFCNDIQDAVERHGGVCVQAPPLKVVGQ